jgi:dipeptidyl aminopeptidase/acylaminoacyl peptidase
VQLAAEQEAIPDAAAFVGNWGAMPEQAKFSDAFPPTLLLHGECDEVVPVAHARATAAALLAAGAADVRLKIYAGERHTIVSGPAAADDAYQTTLTFLAERLGKE